MHHDDVTTATPDPTVGDGGALLVRGATVLSVDERIGELPVGDVLLRNGRIEAVGPDLSDRAAGARVLDARGMIAVPGFVDAHVHAWEGSLRGSGPAVDFAGYLGLTAFGAGPRCTPDDVAAGTAVTAAVALDAGITTIVDNAHNALTPEHAAAGVEALLAAGIRAVVAVGSPFGTELAHVPATAIALRERYAGPLLYVRLFEVHPTLELWRAAQEAGLWISTELGPHTPAVDERLDALAAAGLLTPAHAFNHCYDLSDHAWDLIGDSGAAVNLCPRSDAAFGLGSATPPVTQALTRGVPMGLSGDNEISYGLSMFAEMQALHLRHRAEQFRRAATGEQVVDAELSPRDLLRAATLGGAANAGLADVVGSLTPGKQADLVLIRAGDVATALCEDPISTVTAFAGVGQVDTVVVAGRIRKQGGELVGVDLTGIQHRARRSRRRLAGTMDDQRIAAPVAGGAR